jgi:hypothetical protein
VLLVDILNPRQVRKIIKPRKKTSAEIPKQPRLQQQLLDQIIVRRLAPCAHLAPSSCQPATQPKKRHRHFFSITAPHSAPGLSD